MNGNPPLDSNSDNDSPAAPTDNLVRLIGFAEELVKLVGALNGRVNQLEQRVAALESPVDHARGGFLERR